MEVTIERILPGGLGLAHAEGKTVMVSLAAPGDRLRVRIDRVKGNVSFATIEEIITPSSLRVEPPCPYFGRCGGCDFQQLTYSAQLAAKLEIIRDCLRRLGGIENVPDFQITPAPDVWHYRSRAQWQYDAIRQRLGYFESGSRHVCDVAECAVLAPPLQLSLGGLRERMQNGTLPEEVRDFRAVLGDNDQVSIAPSVRSPTVREGNGRTGTSELIPVITHTIHADTYRLNAELFFQANHSLLPQLIDTAIGNAAGETAIELYCGVGLFTLPLARRFKHVVGVEGDSAATAFARDNLKAAGLSNADVANLDVGRWLDQNAEGGGKAQRRRRFGSSGTHVSSDSSVEPDVNDEGTIQSAVKGGALQNNLDFLLLDPPRTGAESRVIAGILKLQPKRISYVSCDPATLARDLKKLIADGYNLDTITAFDMFPQTHHVETVVHLAA
jgi:23S rRNA (uracil1939-C5)-methyltransferase